MRSPEPSFLDPKSPSSRALSDTDRWKQAGALSPLPPSFYLQPTVRAAKRLLGKGLWVRPPEIKTGLLAEIVETEAYLGGQDPASHAFRGLSKRNGAMFERGGTCYVYLSYGINYCMNVVTGPKGLAEAVLLRAAIPRCGEKWIRQFRGLPEGPPRLLMNGPGKLTQALGIDLSYNGAVFDRADFKLVDLGVDLPESQIVTTPRIGISKAKEAPLRFVVKDSAWLSRRS